MTTAKWKPAVIAALGLLASLSAQTFAAPPGDKSRPTAEPPHSLPRPGRIDRITVEVKDGAGAPEVTRRMLIKVYGQRECRTVRVNYGDGVTADAPGPDLSVGIRFEHTWAGWGGLKTVTAEGQGDCTGKVKTTFMMNPVHYFLGFGAPKRAPCGPIPNRPALTPNSRVFVVVNATPVINFGCPSNSCMYGPDGRPGSSASSRFPFPGLKEYSLVFRVGSQIVQGGTAMNFVSRSGGTLEVCANVDNLTNTGGGWSMNLRVDQLGP